MKLLSLLRHGEAEQPLGVVDRDRNLSSYGAQMTPRLGRRLEQRGFMPDLVISSTATRALETARIMCFELGCDVDLLQQKDEIYQATLHHLLRIVQGIDESLSHVLIVGHNPSLSDLATFLCGPHQKVPTHMSTCALVRIELPVEYWALVDSPVGRFVEYDTPENMN